MAKRDNAPHAIVYADDRGTRRTLAERARGSRMLALFAGDSGTGKTLAAETLAMDLGRPFHKVDLGAVISKYIGETEKNIDRVFADAERVRAVLFFDEAAAFLRKRSDVSDSHDRHANTEVSLLLDRIEAYEGLVILASNLRGEVDEAVARRIRLFVEFPA